MIRVLTEKKQLLLSFSLAQDDEQIREFYCNRKVLFLPARESCIRRRKYRTNRHRRVEKSDEKKGQ